MSKIIINGWIEKDEYGEDVSYINDIPIHDILTDKTHEFLHHSQVSVLQTDYKGRLQFQIPAHEILNTFLQNPCNEV